MGDTLADHEHGTRDDGGTRELRVGWRVTGKHVLICNEEAMMEAGACAEVRWRRVADPEREVSMPPIKDAATEFLTHKRVAVTGVSREPKGHGSNVVYKRLREQGYEVFAVNPDADKVAGDPCYLDLR
jgi:hypothetical protein